MSYNCKPIQNPKLFRVTVRLNGGRIDSPHFVRAFSIFQAVKESNFPAESLYSVKRVIRLPKNAFVLHDYTLNKISEDK